MPPIRRLLAPALCFAVALLTIPASALADGASATSPVSPATDALGPAGWLGVLAVFVGFLVRIVKTNAVDRFLAMIGRRPIPKTALPWISLVLGVVLAGLESLIGGASWAQAGQATFLGLCAGALAIAGQETLPTATRPVAGPTVANVVFGPGAGPNPGPAAPNPSVRPPRPDGGPGPAAGGDAPGGAT